MICTDVFDINYSKQLCSEWVSCFGNSVFVIQVTALMLTQEKTYTYNQIKATTKSEYIPLMLDLYNLHFLIQIYKYLGEHKKW